MTGDVTSGKRGAASGFLSLGPASLLEVLWFREKRSCEAFLNRDFPELESLCTYCNKKFNHVEPVPCTADGCSAEFCSRECMDSHQKLRRHN